MTAKAIPDILNGVRRVTEYNGERLATESMSHVEVLTHDGRKFNSSQLFSVDIANPLYVVYELPANATVDQIELIKRYFQTATDGADLLIFWDYDISTATRTRMDVFNESNKYRGVIDADFTVDLLNPHTLDAATGVYTITGPATILDPGIIREPSFIIGTGVGSNRSGDVNPDVGTRIYERGTGYLVKITSKGNGNIIHLGYTWSEDV